VSPVGSGASGAAGAVCPAGTDGTSLHQVLLPWGEGGER